MKILLSAFACAPNQGSERGLGWNWAVETARLGHEVMVLTQTELRAEIETEVNAGRVPPSLSFEFFMPAWLDRFQARGVAAGYASITWHLTHLMWQVLLYRYVRDWLDVRRFDVVHHLTYSGIRHPTLLGRLPTPLALGPLGGGERAPYALRKGLPWGGWLKDMVRDLHTVLIRLDPITLRACADALVIYVKTRETKQALPRRFHPKVAIQMEIGTKTAPTLPHPVRPAGEPLRLLYAGRFIYWKGMHLGLRAFAAARERGLDARLTMLGQGPNEAAWRQLADRLKLADAIDWLPWVEHNKIGELYRAHDVVVFPSLHDSSGNVVLEALFHGLPVVCLDLGGPGELVHQGCGRVIATDKRSEADCVAAMAEALLELDRDRALLARLSEGAQARAAEFHWPTLVRAFYEDVERRLDRPTTPKVPAAGPIPAGPDEQTLAQPLSMPRRRGTSGRGPARRDLRS
jgi:glycosyltransferase involved in cell wall biosynthesis